MPSFKLKLKIGYDFTGGRIFDFLIDFSMGLTTKCSANALPVIGRFIITLESWTSLFGLLSLQAGSPIVSITLDNGVGGSN